MWLGQEKRSLTNGGIDFQRAKQIKVWLGARFVIGMQIPHARLDMEDCPQNMYYSIFEQKKCNQTRLVYLYTTG